MGTLPDKRINAWRDDLADARLQGLVAAHRFTEGKPARVATHFADLHRLPDAASSLDTQLLYGQDVTVFDQKNGWAWVQNDNDKYVGYVKEETICRRGCPPTHMVLAPRTFLYSGPDLKFPRSGYLSMGSRLVVVDKATERGTDYLILETGEAMIASHVMEMGDWKSDPVEIAEMLVYTPYLWGGSTAFGIDCSGLVSLCWQLCGIIPPRDSDMQAEDFGDEIKFDPDSLQRGDLIFWNGHVGVMSDPATLLHANGNTMNVTREKLADAVERIGYLYGQPTKARRPQPIISP